MLPLFALQRIAEPTPFLRPFFPPPEISSFWGTSTAIIPSGTQKVLPSPMGRKYSIESFPFTTFSLTLTCLLFSIASWAFAPPLISPLLWKMLQDLSFDHLPILPILPLSPIFRPNERPPSFDFQKARRDDFAIYFHSRCSSSKEYSAFFLSSAAALSTSLTLNATKSSIPFGRIKR